VIKVPVGTMIYDAQTEELIADLNEADVVVPVAQGGEGGLGNTTFKSSTNQAPRKRRRVRRVSRANCVCSSS